mgnify:FL=1
MMVVKLSRKFEDILQRIDEILHELFEVILKKDERMVAKKLFFLRREINRLSRTSKKLEAARYALEILRRWGEEKKISKKRKECEIYNRCVDSLLDEIRELESRARKRSRKKKKSEEE